jgi:hypothetical protein
MSKHPGYSYEGNFSGPQVSGSFKAQKESSNTFPYGCKWGCERANVCSKPGNSCGRNSCN